MKRYIGIAEQDHQHPRQFRIGNTKDDDVNYKLLDWDDYYIEISGYFGNIGPHVFAAAPDLLEALESTLNFIENTESELGFKLESGRKARAAIAKAKGETK